ncbi:uncharacterized protein PITG_07436 [Phytophthora infestans T30-4]|uniref:Uncharacterized protein n=1 Tax=Phytophthora infestans (strain T30-4) TaxID=403677 RepID=D0N8E7_PHYIT|nr:uncharacterized protein PITG_07436 [Phytophthora infestans T30-4]EEY53832.1 hypothetical protein PITG_07436 [Phytophthora infestans T30-4]|eukprot:XP_002904463.1 hypothetical protein PITG_07436 [Phytophthora infestans T30-4]
MVIFDKLNVLKNEKYRHIYNAKATIFMDDKQYMSVNFKRQSLKLHAHGSYFVLYLLLLKGPRAVAHTSIPVSVSLVTADSSKGYPPLTRPPPRATTTTTNGSTSSFSAQLLTHSVPSGSAQRIPGSSAPPTLDSLSRFSGF